jgi:membrane protein YqaA with SNARE-associated domain
MTTLYLIIGAIIGGGAGWLLGRFNSRRNRRQECTTPT